MSARASRALGVRADDSRGRPISEALWLTEPEEAGIDRDAMVASLERVIRTGRPEALPLRRCHLSHPKARNVAPSARWWNVINFPMLGADGKVTHIVQRIEDVTATAHMQLVHDLSLPPVPKVLMTALPAAVPKALLKLNNRSSSLLFVGMEQHDRGRLRAGFDEAGYHVSWAYSEQEALTMCTEQRPDCIVLDLSSPQLGDLHICRALRTQPGGAHTAIICLVARRDTAMLDRALMAGADDVLEKPITPRELQSHVQTILLQQPGMSDVVRAHCQALRQQRLRLCSLQQQREHIASFIVHDLKEPLSTIDLRAALLLLDPSLTDQARSLVERIRLQVRATMLQVLNLLDIPMLDDGRLDARCEPMDLFGMVRELLTDFDPRAQARDLTLHSDIEVAEIVADPELLRRAITNLLDNAIRHAPDNSEVAITARRIAGARIELRVIDSGAAIPPDIAERIFDAGAQTEDSPFRSRSGRGLGLAFCKMVAQAHGGEISVGIVRGRTVFSIKLPEHAKRHNTRCEIK